jgi:excinuclease UvrABC nuclease subunit
MSEPLEIYWSGKSGAKYTFWIHPRGTKFTEPCPGIYIYAKETSPHKWSPVYIGQSENINLRLTNHEQQECVDQNGATHIHVSIFTDEARRLAAEKDLIQQWEPPCNTQYVS